MKKIFIGSSAYHARNQNNPTKLRHTFYALEHIQKYYGLTHYKYEIIGFISWQGLKNKKAWKNMKEIYDFRTYKYLGIDK